MRNHHGWGHWPHNQNDNLINHSLLLITSRTGATSAVCRTWLGSRQAQRGSLSNPPRNPAQARPCLVSDCLAFSPLKHASFRQQTLWHKAFAQAAKAALGVMLFCGRRGLSARLAAVPCPWLFCLGRLIHDGLIGQGCQDGVELFLGLAGMGGGVIHDLLHPPPWRPAILHDLLESPLL